MIFYVGALLDKNVFISAIIYRLLIKFDQLLPHDKSYWVFKILSGNASSGLFLDVGANNGISALSFRRINKAFKIVSIEPNPYFRDKLERLKKRLTNFEFLPIGVSDQASSLDFYTPVYHGLRIYTATSCNLNYLRQNVTDLGLVVDKVKFEKTTCRVQTIDSLGLEPTIIKFDTEGHEFEGILGAMQTLESYHPHILLEYAPPTVLGEKAAKLNTLIDDLGYRKFKYQFATNRITPWLDEHYLPSTGNRNIVLIHQSKMHAIPPEYFSDG